MGLFAKLSKNDIQHKIIRCHCAECRYAECYDFFIVMLSGVMLNAVTLSVVMLSVVVPLIQCLRPGALCLESGRLPSAESSAFLQVSPGACSNYITIPKRCFALVGSCLTRKHKSKQQAYLGQMS
jgi:hypothetical protein